MTAVGTILLTCMTTRRNSLRKPAMLRVLLVLVSSLVATSSGSSSLGAAESDQPTNHHATLLGAAPAFFDNTGSRLPSKYASYISQQKYLLLYFASNADAKSQKFTAELIKWYQTNGGGTDVEIILVGKDLADDDPKTWMPEKGMPWLALAQDDANHASITAKYGSPLLPTLVLLDENDEVVARSNEGEKNLGTRVVLKKYLDLTKVPKKK